jgi:zinc and cadmium transporter
MLQFIFPLTASILLSFVSLIGVVVLPLDLIKKNLKFLIALAAGTMVGDVFLHILPHTIEENIETFDHNSFVWLIVGVIIFYLLETAFHWHHEHTTKDMETPHHIGKLAVAADSLHNFFDGVGIAVAFAISPTVGIATTFAFMMHELPQEIGDYAIYISSGWSKQKALVMNFLSGLTAVVGCIIGLFLIESFELIEQPILMVTAGSLIYIALADLIPQSNLSHSNGHKKFRFKVFASFVFGILLMYGISLLEESIGI